MRKVCCVNREKWPMRVYRWKWRVVMQCYVKNRSCFRVPYGRVDGDFMQGRGGTYVRKWFRGTIQETVSTRSGCILSSSGFQVPTCDL